MKYLFFVVMVLTFLAQVPPARGIDCATARSSGERDALIDLWREEAGDFIFQVWNISRGDLSSEERQKQYDACAQKLISKARELKMGIESLGPLAQTCITEQEANRRPPQGWDPDDAKGNLPLFSEMSGRMVQLHLQLYAYGRQHCK
jgi:hypothetical protein